MRALTYAAIIGVGLTAAGAAFAAQWSDPAGRVTFTAPSGWVTEQQHAPATQTIVLTGNANNECYVITTPNPGTASAPPNRLHNLIAPISTSDWQTIANSVRPMFPHGGAQVTSQSVDTISGYWPIQRAQLGGAERPVIASLSRRPGVDLIGMCWTYDGPDATATYETFFRSIGNANDATWQATGEQQAATQTAAQQAAEQQQAQQPLPDTRSANQRRDRSHGGALPPHP